MVNVKPLNGSEHDGRDLLNDDMDCMLSQVAENNSFFFIEIENFRGKGKILMRGTHMTHTFSEKILDFYKILEESQQFFIFIFLKKMENLKRFFSIFEV